MAYKWTEEYVLYDLQMCRGFVWYSYAMENDGWLQFAGVKRKSKGYIAAEIEKLITQHGQKD